MSDRPVELTLEQQFNLRTFEDQVQKMNLEQAQHFLVKMYELQLMRETTYRKLLKHEWTGAATSE